MTKDEFKLIHKILPNSNPKNEVCFAQIDFTQNVLYVTNTKTLIQINLTDDEVEMCNGVHYIHKKIINVLAQHAQKDKKYTFLNNNVLLDDIALHISTHNKQYNFKYPNMQHILLKTYFEKQFTRRALEYIDFDTTHYDTHINSDAFKPFQEFALYDNYRISVKPQEKESVGMVKIEGFINRDDNPPFKRLEAIIMGVEYTPPQPTLFG